ncbi:MAG TPA: hypothetical protein VMA72_29025 [Streptosporangiaceae bacterium]|nr:hypothetical protein [Streptosporangiaceae bacterium]
MPIEETSRAVHHSPFHTSSAPLDIAPGPGTRRDAVVSWLRDRGVKTAAELPDR